MTSHGDTPGMICTRGAQKNVRRLEN